MGTNYNTAYNFVKKNYSTVKLGSCPLDCHPLGGFRVSDCGILIENFVAIRHPGPVRRRRTRVGIQKELDYIEPSLDSGSRAVKRRSSGMTALVNCNIVSSGEEIFEELR